MVAKPHKCVRCRQVLPVDSGFCVSCGHQNEAAIAERKLSAIGQADKRISWAKKLRDWLWSSIN